jgi:hypothetical protein
MTAFQKEALATQRYDRDKLLASVDEVTTHFRMPNSFERSKMRAVCRYLADALDRCSGSTLQQRWNDFEKRFWPKWKTGVDRRGRDYWTWGARVLISARMYACAAEEKCGADLSTHVGQPRAQPGGCARSQRTCRTDRGPRDGNCQDQGSIAESGAIKR